MDKCSFDNFKRTKDCLICIDSDGCAMDTMDIKHKHCFGPCMVREWGLEAHEKAVLDIWNEVNLYTMTRGTNRFKGLLLTMQLCGERGICHVEGYEEIRAWADKASALSNTTLKAEIEDAEKEKRDCNALKKALDWSLRTNECIAALPEDEMLPFDGMIEKLEKMHEFADVAVVSSANPEAVRSEWNRHGLVSHIDIMLTQEVGPKSFCIKKMLEYGYDKDKVIMIGDAPGDRKSAEKTGVKFFPILVNHEVESWDRFMNEGLEKFTGAGFDEAYQNDINKAFDENLGEA
ncbi:MAG: HAD hydrolase-like protein [Candidatus Avilachnospira sp.]|jgi:phosphoglycolate phosphatase-like HAD superfamily hydrolase